MDFTISFQPQQIDYFDDLSVRIYQKDSDLAQDAATIAQTYLQSLLQQQEIVRIILATGNSQLHFLEKMTTAKELDWSRIVFFHLDEYLGIQANHPGSFHYYLQQKVEQKISSEKFYYLQGDALQPLEECTRYSKLLQQQPLDLCLLGIGDNGHLAFNEPTVANFVDARAVKIVKLTETTRQQQVDSGSFPSLVTVPQYAYTLTIPTICSAQKILCLAPGKHKAAIVNQMLQGSISEDCPASILRKQPQATLFLDRHSASLI